MRLLALLALFEAAISAPPLVPNPPVSNTNNAPPALELIKNGFGKDALFIPHGEVPEGFDPMKPIQGTFFVNSNTEPFNRVPFRPQQIAPSTTAAPQPLPVDPNLPPVDKSVDLDGDGRLSLEEVQYAAFVHHGLSGTVVQDMFNEVDHNKDGYLNSAEFNDIRALVLAKAENAALRYMQSVDTDKNKLLSLQEAQAYILKDHGIGSRDVERIWKLVVPNTSAELDAQQFSKLRRRIRGMTIRLARQIMKIADTDGDGRISQSEAQAIAFEQEGLGAGDVAQMFASVDDNNDGELNAPEFADFERIVRARAVETSKKALRVVDTDASNTLTMDEARRIAFEHYGFDENTLGPFFDQADENEDGQLDAVEFAGFRSVIRNKAVRNAALVLKEIDLDGDGMVSLSEAEEKTKREDDMDSQETAALFNIADQNKSGKLDKVELADFIRLVRLSAIRFATDHFKEFDMNHDRLVTVDELAQLIENKYNVPYDITREFFAKVDIDASGDLIPAEIVDFRHEIRKFVALHPSLAAAAQKEEQEDRESVLAKQREDIITTTTSTSSTTTAPRTTASTTSSTSPSPSTTTTHRRRMTTTHARPISTTSETVSTVSTTYPTLLPSTRRKVTFRKHSTLIPQTNDIEEPNNPAAFGVKTHQQPVQDADAGVEDVDISASTRVPQVWKHRGPTSTTQTPLQTTTEEVEYEIVEVEVDENGNEIETDATDNSEEEPAPERPAQKAHNTQGGTEVQVDARLGKRKNQELLEREERRKLVEAQKRALNLPPDTEVEYLDSESTKRPEEYEETEE
uniref:EF hand domain containing protein n=1 Tax=Haemonchus contortus TaxID=6289 RepID=A0A7I4YAR7_HAECO